MLFYYNELTNNGLSPIVYLYFVLFLALIVFWWDKQSLEVLRMTPRNGTHNSLAHNNHNAIRQNSSMIKTTNLQHLTSTLIPTVNVSYSLNMTINCDDTAGESALQFR